MYHPDRNVRSGRVTFAGSLAEAVERTTVAAAGFTSSLELEQLDTPGVSRFLAWGDIPT